MVPDSLRNQIYKGHITHLMHSSGIVNRYRLYVFTANTILIATAGHIYFLKGFGSEQLDEKGRLLILIGLCLAALSITAALHLLTHIYLRVIEYVEMDLARLASPYQEVSLWHQRLSRRKEMREYHKLLFQMIYFGTFWIFYIGIMMIISVALMIHFLECPIGVILRLWLLII